MVDGVAVMLLSICWTYVHHGTVLMHCYRAMGRGSSGMCAYVCIAVVLISRSISWASPVFKLSMVYVHGPPGCVLICL
jgi:hypothetical protein